MNEEITNFVFRKWFSPAFLAVVALLVLLLLPGISHALTLKQKPLVGLKGVQVLVESLEPEAERLGLTNNQIKTDVELLLRKAGIRVLTQEEMENTSGMPYLYVNVNTSIGGGLIAYNISVELSEFVTLANGLQAFGVIWDTGRIGTVLTNNIRQIRDSIGDEVDNFINDYLAANPK